MTHAGRPRSAPIAQEGCFGAGERVIRGLPLTTEEVNPMILDFVSQLIAALRAIIGI
ncbi:hypothetical protein [Nocardia farcinica]|uniref:hypothetical protein n=1 Tax=Nocardia farcinica TaxID=37329 RepID=UPI001895B063|nr:hypothetical protein [Nocardia farcinica]MBF6520289.1 hypothetical protein [Nocardia farcinica]